jgi:cytochrome c peroxidase
MRTRAFGILLGLLSSILSLSFCSKEPKVPSFVGFEAPKTWNKLVYDLNTNPITEAGFTLGKKLFYDPILSVDGTISCGSCHQQSAAFAHNAHDLSHGVRDLLGTRNAPTLQNLAWSKSFGWDGGVPHLDLFPISPIENPVEMAEKMPNVLQKLRNHVDYPRLFERAFGSSQINTATLSQALSQFQLMLVSDNTRYDQYLGGDKSVLNSQEKSGLDVFRQYCTSCHTEPLLTNGGFANNGLPFVHDEGRYAITLDSSDLYRFKVPSLRNVAVSAPYFHDGRVRTLAAAVEHYRSGVQKSTTLDLRDGKLTFSDAEKQDLVAFLGTLTDTAFVRDTRFGE